MTQTIAVYSNHKTRLVKFLKAENIDLAVDQPGCELVALQEIEKRVECGSKELYSGGWIRCETARELSEQLGLKLSETGKVLEFLEIKVCHCALGCFQ